MVTKDKSATLSQVDAGRSLDAEELRKINLSLACKWMTTLDQPAWWDMIHEDMVLEFPYAASLGLPERYEGRTAFVDYAKTLFKRLGVFKFFNLNIVGTDDPSLFVAEYDAQIVTARGENYKQIYINKLRFKDGKMIFMREFWDPKRIADANNGNFSFNS